MLGPYLISVHVQLAPYTRLRVRMCNLRSSYDRCRPFPFEMACKDVAGESGTRRCSVCLDDYKEPKVLPCCHTFCKPCLAKLGPPSNKTEGGVAKENEPHKSITVEKAVENEAAKQTVPSVIITCPECRAQHQIVGGVDMLLTNFSIVDEQNKLSSSNKSQDTTATLHCGLCESIDPVVSYCTDCLSGLCDFCHKAHQRQKIYHGHCIKKVDDIDTSALTEMARTESKGQLVCTRHPKEVPQIFCKSCDELVCCQCIVDQHDGHKFARIDSEMRSEFESKLRDMMMTARDNLRLLEDDLAYVNAVESVTCEVGTKLDEDIKRKFDSFIAALQKRRDELLAKSEQYHSAKLKTLWSEKDYLENTIAKLSSCLRFSEQSQKCHNAGEFLALATQGLQSLKDFRNTFWKSTPVEKAHSCYLDLEVKRSELRAFKHAAQCNEVSTHTKNINMTIKFKEFPAKVNIGSEHKVIVCVTRSKDDTPCVVYNKPSIKIQYKESITCQVADISVHRSTTLPGAWEVKFIPYCGGRHNITCIVKVEKGHVFSQYHDFCVSGVPSIGSKVMRGPSWNYDEDLHGYGASASEVAVVRDHDGLASDKTIAVTWSDGKSFQYRWGENDEYYDIQLYHKIDQ